MVNRVLEEYGGFAGRYIDDCGKYIIMHKAIKQIEDMLSIYTKQCKYPAFTKTMVETVSEYKLCGIDPEVLDEAQKKTHDSMLAKKLSDISLIMRTYDALLENDFMDNSDDLVRLAEKLKTHSFFKGTAVFIDTFKGFTSQEKTIIKEILAQADDVYITLCTDKLNDDEGGYGLFSR